MRTSVTIVTPVCNGMRWLPEAAKSIMSQDCEWIVLDGGSTDGSREWLREHATNARLIFQPDHGQTDALNHGFDLATGDICGWLNADDVYEPGALEWVREAFASNPDAVAVSGRCLWIEADSTVTGEIPQPPDGSLRGLLAYPYNLPQPATFFRLSAFEEVRGLNPRLDMAMDVDLWLKLAGLSDIVLLPDMLARHRRHPAAKSHAGALAAVREDFAIRRRYGMPLEIWWHFTRVAYLRPLKQRLSRLTRP